MNNRISTLDIRLNQIEKTVDFLYENFEKGKNQNTFVEHTSGLMATHKQGNKETSNNQR